MESSAKIGEEEPYIVRLQGSLDLYNSPDIRAELLENAAVRKSMLIDLSGVVYADSSGVGVLTYMLSHAKRNGILLQFRGIRGQVRNVLSLNRILDLMDIVPGENG